MNDEQIRLLLYWFVGSSETHKKYGPGRQKAMNENHKWIQPKKIRKMTEPELTKKVQAYLAPSGNGRAQLTRGKSIVDDIKKLRKALLHLLDESLDISQRMNDVLDGQYKVNGFGPLRVTSFLTDFKPKKYCLWSRYKTPEFFETIGLREPPYHSPGYYYAGVLNMESKLTALVPDLNLNLVDIDLFLYTISDILEDKKDVEKVKSLAGRLGQERDSSTRERELPKSNTYGYKVKRPEQVTDARKREKKLLDDYQRWLENRGHGLLELHYARLRCDGWEKERHNLIEAKASTSREDVRMAVGQLFDYKFQGRDVCKQPNMAILMPRKPAWESVEWLEHLGIRLIWPSRRAFVDNANGQFT